LVVSALHLLLQILVNILFAHTIFHRFDYFTMLDHRHFILVICMKQTELFICVILHVQSNENG
jgi:hypothetical protein